MGIICKNHLLINKTAQTSKPLKMLRFAVFTFLALAVVTEAAPGGGYYWKKRYYKKPAPPAPAAPVAKAAPVGDLVDVTAGATVKAADVTTGSVGTFGGENIDLVKDDAG